MASGRVPMTTRTFTPRLLSPPVEAVKRLDVDLIVDMTIEALVGESVSAIAGVTVWLRTR